MQFRGSRSPVKSLMVVALLACVLFLGLVVYYAPRLVEHTPAAQYTVDYGIYAEKMAELMGVRTSSTQSVSAAELARMRLRQLADEIANVQGMEVNIKTARPGSENIQYLTYQVSAQPTSWQDGIRLLTGLSDLGKGTKWKNFNLTSRGAEDQIDLEGELEVVAIDLNKAGF